MGFETGDGQRHHQLLRVPKSQNHALPLAEQVGQMLHALGAPTHRAAQKLNHMIADRRHHRDFERIRQALRQSLLPGSILRPGCHGIAHLFNLESQLLRQRVGKLHGVQPLVEATLP